MAVMFGNLYDALRSVGVDEGRARAAAEELAAESPTQDVKLLKASLGEAKTDLASLKKDVLAVRTDVAVLRWMVGFVLAGLIGGFSIMARLIVH